MIGLSLHSSCYVFPDGSMSRGNGLSACPQFEFSFGGKASNDVRGFRSIKVFIFSLVIVRIEVNPPRLFFFPGAETVEKTTIAHHFQCRTGDSFCGCLVADDMV